MKNVINTPFGNFQVKLNGTIIDFKCTSKIYIPNKSKEHIRLYLIDIDTTNMNVTDQITCGFEDSILEHCDRDRFHVLTAENNSLTLGLCGYEPQYYEAERVMHSFYMKETNGNGFTYVIERNPKDYEDKEAQTRTITLALCCVEKNKFKDEKKIIKESLKEEIKYEPRIAKKETQKKRKETTNSNNTFVTIFLFILFLILYLLVSFVLIEQKIISNLTKPKMIIGIIGVLLISFACGNLGVKIVTKPKKRNPKTQYMITVILLILLFASLDMIIYMILCASGMIQNQILLLLGLTIVSISFIILIASNWKPKEETKLEELDETNVLITKKPELESVLLEKNQLESMKQKKVPLNSKLLQLHIAFPKTMKKELLEIANTIQLEEQVDSKNNFDTTYLLNQESVTIPYRIFYEEIESFETLTEQQKRMLYCIYTRNPNGYIREKYIKRLLEKELQSFEIPYIVKASEDYVEEVIKTIYEGLKDKDNKKIEEFVKDNKEEILKHYQKMTNYWNLHYRETPFHHYVGRKLFRECFGYSKKMEKKRFQCACCGNYTINGYLTDYYHIKCPVCYWQNNKEQNEKPNLVTNENNISLIKAKENYETIRVIKEEFKNQVREPFTNEKEQINVERMLKYLKLNLLTFGCERKKDSIHPFYEYQNHYFKISFEEEFVLSESHSLEDARICKWDEIKRYDQKLEKEELLKEIINTIKKQVKPKSKKKLTKKDKLEIIKEQINKWDPVGLIKVGASEDEYSEEIAKIGNKINKIETKEELGIHIEQVFQKMFGENIFKNKKKEVEKVAQEIWKQMK